MHTPHRVSTLLAALLALGLPILAQAPAIPDYSQTERAKVPVEARWRLEDIYADEAAWRKELNAVAAEVKAFAPALEGWTASPKAMADRMERQTALLRRISQLQTYAILQSDMDLQDARYQAMKGEINNVARDLAQLTATQTNQIQALGAAKMEAFVKAEPRLKPFAFGFERALREKDHTPTEAQQKVLSLSSLLMSGPSSLFDILNDSEVPRPAFTAADGSQVVMNMNNYMRFRTSQNAEDRRGAFKAFWTSQKAFENSFANTVDSTMKQDLFMAKAKGFDTCLKAALYAEAIPEEVYRRLLSATRANLAPLHRYLRLKKRLLGVDELQYSDLWTSVAGSASRTYTFDEARKTFHEAMAPLGPEYQQVLKKGLEDRWIDIYSNKNKMSGAYCFGVYGLHPYVKLNYDGSYAGVSMLAHEMGHAMHYHYAGQAQAFQAYDAPIFLAEMASTFNEVMLVNHLLKKETDDRFKLFMLENYLERFRSLLFRQTIFAELDLFMHEQVEQGKNLTAESLNAKYLELLRTYYGEDKGVLKVDGVMGIEWSIVTQFFNNYYVYSYATGMIASAALAEAVLREGEPARQRYLGFLKSGSSTWPMDILQKAGVDMAKPQPYEAAMRTFERLVGEMEAVADRLESGKAKRP